MIFYPVLIRFEPEYMIIQQHPFKQWPQKPYFPYMDFKWAEHFHLSRYTTGPRIL